MSLDPYFTSASFLETVTDAAVEQPPAAVNDSAPEEEPTEPVAVKGFVNEYESGLVIRFCEASRFEFLRWQAGQFVSEHRAYQDLGMFTPFNQRVSLFWLLGYGSTRGEAIEMALKSPNRRRE